MRRTIVVLLTLACVLVAVRVRQPLAAQPIAGLHIPVPAIGGVGRSLPQHGQITLSPPPSPDSTPGASDGEIAGRVWEDVDGNGQFDPDEPPLIGVRVNLAQGSCQYPVGVFMSATVSDRDGGFQFNFPIPEPTPGLPPMVRVVVMMPERFRMTTSACQTVRFDTAEPEPQNANFGARRLWDEPIYGSFLLENYGDQFWVNISNPDLAEELATYEEGRNWWFCGHIVPDPLLPWGFRFDPVGLAQTTIEVVQTTLRQIASQPVYFAQNPWPGGWCIVLRAVLRELAAPPTATRTPATTSTATMTLIPSTPAPTVTATTTPTRMPTASPSATLEIGATATVTPKPTGTAGAGGEWKVYLPLIRR